jgi:hypothetical protein
LRIVVLGAHIVALLEEIISLFLELLRHLVAKNECPTTVWKEQKRKKKASLINQFPRWGDPLCRRSRGCSLEVHEGA